MPYFNVDANAMILELADTIDELVDDGSIFTASEASNFLRTHVIQTNLAMLNEWYSKFTPDEMEKEVLTNK